MMKMKTVAMALLVVLVLPLIAACSQIGGKETDTTERVLRIAIANYDESSFRQQFTEIFEFAHPNITLEIEPVMESYMYGMRAAGEKMPDPFELLMERMQGDNPPDVVMFNYDQLSSLITNNLLLQLDPMITKDKFDISDIVPAVIDGLKKTGDNKLYALAPIFSSSALIYNKAIFDQAGVNYPTDGMTWEQMFDLARRLSRPDGDNPIYGFNFNTSAYMDLYYGMQQYIIPPLQLRMFNDDATKMTVDGDQWARVWSMMLRLQQDKIVPPSDDRGRREFRVGSDGRYNPFAYDDFLSGRLAMSIISYGQLDQIINANKNAANFPGFTPISWDVVTVPSHPEQPGVGGNMYMNGVMGINAKAQNVQDAWRFIKFVNGPEWARAKSYNSYQLVSRKSYIKPPGGTDFHIEAFYQMTPAPQPPENQLYRTKPNLYRVQELGRNLFQQVLQGNIEIRDALKQWQTEGDSLLQQIKDNPDGPIDVMPIRIR